MKMYPVVALMFFLSISLSVVMSEFVFVVPMKIKVNKISYMMINLCNFLVMVLNPSLKNKKNSFLTDTENE